MGNVNFFPGGGTVIYTAGASTAYTDTIATGALVGGVTKTITHGFALTDVSLSATDGVTNVLCDILRVNGADPTNKIDVQVGVDMGGGLNIIITGNV